MSTLGGASLHGDAAIGGVIQVLTDSATNGDVFTVSGGSLGTFSFDGTSRWRRRSVGGFLSGAARRTNGISEHSDASELTFGTAVGGKLGALSWHWTANVVDRDQDDPGFEAEVQGPAAARVRPIATYTLSDVTAASADTQLKNVPRHQVMVGATASLGWKLETFASVRRAWGAFLDGENRVPTRSRPLFDVRVRRAIRNATVFGDLLNAFDQRYDEFGFVLADFRGGRVGYVYPGQPRVLRVGVTLDLK